MTSERVLDLNADLGESFGLYRYGHDEQLMPMITSANVACGFHAGDPRTLREAVELALANGVSIGAHTGLPDRLGFGRRAMQIDPQDAYDYALYQIAACDGFVRAQGARLRHVKPHGALYMMASADEDLADGIARAVVDADPELAVYALPGSALDRAATARGLGVVREFFADRPYDGTEVVMFGWTPDDIGGPADAADRIDAMLDDRAFDGVGTVCVHSDTVGAPAIAEAVGARLRQRGTRIAAPGR